MFGNSTQKMLSIEVLRAHYLVPILLLEILSLLLSSQKFYP